MTDTIEARRTIGERYADAAGAVDLSQRRTDADVLLAAGFAAAGNASGALALDLWRMKQTGDMRSYAKLIEVSANKLIGRPAGRTRLARKMPRADAIGIASVVLNWWIGSICPACEGRRHPLAPNTSRVDDSRDCGECRGTGASPLDVLVRQDQREHARWLAGEYDAMAGGIFKRMAEKLAPTLDLR